MSARKKTWAEKMLGRTVPVVEALDKPFAGYPPGAKMLIATPLIVKTYIDEIKAGNCRTIPQMRADLAQRFGADMTCPLTAGIYARIVSEAALDDLRNGKTKAEITPFWRLVDPKSPLAKKLSCGPDFVLQQRQVEAQ